MSNIQINPMQTTVATGSFAVQSTGFIQGMMLDDPAVRNELAGGVLASSETLPMWGGVGIAELIPTQGAGDALGGNILRATALSGGASPLTGFSVFNQNHAGIITPQSPVPLSTSGMLVNFFRLGSNARIAVGCEPSLANLEGGLINQQVSWSFVNQLLQPYDASDATETITTMIWSDTNGGEVAVVMGEASVFGLDDIINISGATNAGTAGNTAVNGNFVINTYTDSTHFTFLLPAAAGEIGAIAGTPVINTGTGALNVRVLEVQVGNSMTVDYDSDTGFATWDRSGTAAIILI